MPLTVGVGLSARDRDELLSWTRSPSLRAGLAQRARVVLLAADGVGTNEIVRRVGLSKPAVIGWKRRFAAEQQDVRNRAQRARARHGLNTSLMSQRGDPEFMRSDSKGPRRL